MTVRWPIVKPTMHRYLIGGAWFFIVVSLLFLAWAVAVLLPNAAGSDATFYQAMTDGRTIKAVGLSYVGASGVALALLQTGIVVSAATATLLGSRKWRRIGHVVLFAWAALWAINLFWLTSIDQMLLSYGQSVTMATLLGCTAYRALVNWHDAPDRTGCQRSPAVQDEPDAAVETHEEVDAMLLTAADLEHSHAVQPIHVGPKHSYRSTAQRAARTTLAAARRTGSWSLKHTVTAGRRVHTWLRQRGVLPGRSVSRQTRSA